MAPPMDGLWGTMMENGDTRYPTLFIVEMITLSGIQIEIIAETFRWMEKHVQATKPHQEKY